MRKLIKSSLYLAIASTVLVSCSDDDDDNDNPGIPQITIPNEYISPDFAGNAANQIALTDALAAFTGTQKAADGGNTVTEADMLAAWNGTSLKDATPSSFVAIVENELPILATASGAGNYDWSTAPNNDGGHFENRVFSPTGIECVQLTEKGLFGAALYNEANEIIEEKGTNISAADIDGLVALYGTTPAFPNSDNVANNPDKFQAKYAARRTQAAGGMYLNIKKYFIEARTYADAGADYNAQKQLALSNLLKEWERSLAATTINYLWATVDKLSQTNLDDATIEDGMHAYGEGVGFLSGVLANPAGHRMISDAVANQALNEMLAPYGGTPSSYQLVQTPATSLLSIQDALNTLQQAYGFSNEEMEGFKKNWVNEEGR